MRNAGGIATDTSYATKAELEGREVPPFVQALFLRGYEAAGDGGGMMLARVGSTEPTHGMGIQDASGVWWEPDLVGQPLFGAQCGLKADKTTDDTAALRRGLKYASAASTTFSWRGHARITEADSSLVPIRLPEDASSTERNFAIVGETNRLSTILLDGAFTDYPIRIVDELGLFQGPNSGDTAPDGYTHLLLRNFAIIGNGRDNTTGEITNAQKGLAFEGRHGNVSIENVSVMDITGTGVAFGNAALDNPTQKYGFRESNISNLRVYNCGNRAAGEPAVLFSNDSTTFGTNYTSVFRMEVNHANGQALVLENNNPDSSQHAIGFFWLKCHGSDGSEYADRPDFITDEALVIRGAGGNPMYFYAFQTVQCGRWQDASPLSAILIEANAGGSPKNIVFDGLTVNSCYDAVRINAGENIVLNFAQCGAENDVLVVGSDVQGPIKVTLPDEDNIEYSFSSDLNASLAVDIAKLELPAELGEKAWTKYSISNAFRRVFNNDDTAANVMTMAKHTMSGDYEMYCRMHVDSTTAAGFRYQIVSVGGAFSAMTLTERVTQPDGTSATQAIAVGDQDTDQDITFTSDGIALIELYGTISNSAATALNIRAAQAVATAVDTNLIKGRLELRRIS